MPYLFVLSGSWLTWFELYTFTKALGAKLCDGVGVCSAVSVTAVSVAHCTVTVWHEEFEQSRDST